MKIKQLFFSALMAITLSGCAILPDSGPSGSDVQRDAKIAGVSVIKVTPALAERMRQAVLVSQRRRIATNLNGLRRFSKADLQTKLFPGDVLSIKLWAAPLLPSRSSDISAKVFDIHHVTLRNNGSVALPYVGTVYLGGKTVPQAEQILQKAFQERASYADPQVLIHVRENRGQSILVTGYAVKPKRISWRPGGVTLASALIEVRGFNAAGSEPNRSSLGRSRTIVIREHGRTFILPGRVAESSRISLLPGATVALRMHVQDHVLSLGGGLAANTTLAFSRTPSLAAVLARTGGLNPQTARAQSVFVLSPDHKVVYRFHLNRLSGLRAAQDFPIRNRSVIYVSTAPSVRLQQAMQILFSPFYPAAAIKGVA